jgi:hypothetical protein
MRQKLSSLLLSLNPFTLEPRSTSEASYRSHRDVSYAAPINIKAYIKALKMSEPILHWESTQSIPYGCKTMQLFNQGEEECDSSDAVTIVPHDSSDSGLTTSTDFDEFGEDPWDDSEFATYQCNSIKICRIPSRPVKNPHDHEEDLNDIIVNSAGNVCRYIYPPCDIG